MSVNEIMNKERRFGKHFVLHIARDIYEERNLKVTQQNLFKQKTGMRIENS